MRTSSGSETDYWDDLYVCDGNGTTNNTFLGDIQVQTLMPSGAGSSTQFTPTGATANWRAVADVPYSTAEYVEVATTPVIIPRHIDSEYVEAVTTPTVVPHISTTLYIEVVTPVPIASIEGWGIPID